MKDDEYHLQINNMKERWTNSEKTSTILKSKLRIYENIMSFFFLFTPF